MLSNSASGMDYKVEVKKDCSVFVDFKRIEYKAGAHEVTEVVLKKLRQMGVAGKVVKLKEDDTPIVVNKRKRV